MSLIYYEFKIFKCLRDSSIDFSGVLSFWLIFITLHINIFFWLSCTSEPIYLFLNFFLTSLPISICLRILSLKVSCILNELFYFCIFFLLNFINSLMQRCLSPIISWPLTLNRIPWNQFILSSFGMETTLFHLFIIKISFYFFFIFFTLFCFTQKTILNW